MKIKAIDRVVLVVCAVVLVLGAVYLIALTDFQTRLYTILLGGLMVAAAAYLATLPMRYRGSNQNYVTQQNENGELRISLNAVENLVDKCIEVHDEIRVNERKVIVDHSGVIVDLSGVSLANNISIPLAVSSLQKQIRQYVMAASGVEVRDVRVTVSMTEEPEEKLGSPFKVDSLETPEKPVVTPEEQVSADEEETPEKPEEAVTEEETAEETDAAKAETPVSGEENASAQTDAPAEEQPLPEEAGEADTEGQLTGESEEPADKEETLPEAEEAENDPEEQPLPEEKAEAPDGSTDDAKETEPEEGTNPAEPEAHT